jgi:hypothetical protein
MKKIIPLFIALYFSLSFGEGWGEVAFAQTNLVPNPSFEDTVNCPQHISYGAVDEMSFSKGWWSCRGTPDYFSKCSPSSGNFSCYIPSNCLGYQNPSLGNAYAGFSPSFNGNTNNEAIQTRFSSNLIKGKKYYVSFKLNFFDSPNFSSCAVNNIGALFTNDSFSEANPIQLINKSHFKYNSILTDTVNWILIKGSVVSDSNYSFLCVGNFYVDSLTNKVQLSGSICESYYYIDDVCVSEDSTTCGFMPLGIDVMPKSEIKIYPNPTIKTLVVSNSNQNSVAIFYDINGDLVLKRQISSNNEDIDLSTFQNGLYFLIIINDETVIYKTTISKQ